MYSDRTDFNDFIIDMRSKWSDARALGSKITDEDFKDIIISSLSESWSSVTTPLYDPGMTSVDAMAHLQIWHTKSHRNQLTNNTQSTLALQTSVPKQESRSQLIYINPNCHRHGHTIEMCYWPGGGKEGQFPPGFSKRSGFRGLAANTQQGGFKSLSTANATTTSEESNQISTCMTMGDFKFKVSTISTLNKIHRPDNRTPPSFSVINQQTYNTIGVEVLNNISREILLACHMDPINKTAIPTLLDSGASNHCFADLSLFTSYTLFEQPSPGLTAEEELTFNIVGKGSVELQTNINGGERSSSIMHYTVTNFIWSYLHQFFDDSHGLKASLKPLRRPFDRY